ncbi:MAG TPA: DUF3524 domain-containing protein [Tepidisphaeraceae bacterium]|nr:DUF3524 domain-containing protein [Tepidisphaeraceae bacterium]
MSIQLDILALEPFYGGIRRIMLEALMRYSRHHWTVLKLPPRRIERRLSAASVWFSELLTRHWTGSIDVLFTSEALNLADLYRLHPELMKKPSVVYFHSNQLPSEDGPSGPLDLVNLNTAMASTEIWFNSLFHLRTFLSRATALVNRHHEIAGQNPVATMAGKAHLMPPPVETKMFGEITANEVLYRNKRNIFLETRDADLKILNTTFGMLRRRGENFNLFTVGPVEGLMADVPRTTLPENDEMAQCRAMLNCGIFLSSKMGTPFDHFAVRALAAGCWPQCPVDAVYSELMPEVMHSPCLYEYAPDTLAGRMQDHWHLEHEHNYEYALGELLRRFDPQIACKAIDDRLDELVISHSVLGSSTSSGPSGR